MATHPQGPAAVLFVQYGRDWIRGSERCLLDLVAQVDRARFRPVVWCNAPTLADAARSLGATVHHAPTVPAAAGRLPVSRPLVRAARALVRRHGVRLIHANDTGPLPALVVAARAERVPLLAHLHLVGTEEERRWALLHQATLAVGVSRASVEGLLADGMPPERVTVIYNAVDGDRLARGSAAGLRAELGIPAGALVVTAVASLIHRKGVDTVLHALAGLAGRGVDVHLLLCGDGPDEAGLRALSSALGVAPRVHFLGVRADVGPILRDATDVLASAARLEAFPLNLLEAGECGIPVVVRALSRYRRIGRFRLPRPRRPRPGSRGNRAWPAVPRARL